MKRNGLLVILSIAFAALVLKTADNKRSFDRSTPFAGLGDLDGGISYSAAHDVSADGTVVVGSSHSSAGVQAFRWTEEVGISGLGFSNAYAVSADGAVVAGFRTLRGRSEPVRWTALKGVEGLDPRHEFESGAAYGISNDGSTLVGVVATDQHRFPQGDMAFQYVSHGDVAHLNQSGGLASCSEAHAVSANGAVVVGAVRRPSGHNEASLWTRESGATGLGFLPGHTTSIAFGVSADGSVVVGCSSDLITSEAFRWTKETGLVGIGKLPGGNSDSCAHAVSADGQVIVGYCATRSGWEAFAWSAMHGMRSVRQILESNSQLGDALRDWKLRSATAVSADGSVVVGCGVNPKRQPEAWIARVADPRPPVTAPPTIGGRQTVLSR